METKTESNKTAMDFFAQAFGIFHQVFLDIKTSLKENEQHLAFIVKSLDAVVAEMKKGPRRNNEQKTEGDLSSCFLLEKKSKKRKARDKSEKCKKHKCTNPVDTEVDTEVDEEDKVDKRKGKRGQRNGRKEKKEKPKKNGINKTKDESESTKEGIEHVTDEQGQVTRERSKEQMNNNPAGTRVNERIRILEPNVLHLPTLVATQENSLTCYRYAVLVEYEEPKNYQECRLRAFVLPKEYNPTVAEIEALTPQRLRRMLNDVKQDVEHNEDICLTWNDIYHRMFPATTGEKPFRVSGKFKVYQRTTMRWLKTKDFRHYLLDRVLTLQ